MADALKESTPVGVMQAGLDNWYPGIQFKNGTLNLMPAICTLRRCFLTDTIMKGSAVWLEGESSLCTMEHCYIEGGVEMSKGARLDMKNCHVLAVTDHEEKTKSAVRTLLKSSTNVAGSLFSSQKRSSEAVASSDEFWPAVQYMDKTVGTVRNCLFVEQERGVLIENSEVKVERNMFFKCKSGVYVWRKSKAIIDSNTFNDCEDGIFLADGCLLYTSPSPRD